MWLLFVPLLIVFAVLFGVGALFAGVLSLIGPTWPLLLIGVGIWMFWHDDGRHRHRRRHTQTYPSVDAINCSRPAPVSTPETRKRREPEAKAAATVEPDLPIDLQVKVEQIRRKVDVLLGYADRFPPFSQDLYLVRQTATDYLPRTISTYLALPNDTRVGESSNTAEQELRSQLDLLDSKLDEIARDLQRQDADRLLANRRFLEQRFGMRDTPRVDVA